MKALKIIGRVEYADFPEFGLSQLEAKTDTGAYTSSIHCESIRKTGDSEVSFVLLDKDHPFYTGEEIIMPIIKETQVKSSSGHTEDRFVIKTNISLLGGKFDIFLTLTNRGDMKYPVLLGRKFLAHKFVVDVRLKHQS